METKYLCLLFFGLFQNNSIEFGILGPHICEFRWGASKGRKDDIRVLTLDGFIDLWQRC